MDRLTDKLWKELEELDEKVDKEGKLSVGDLELAHKLTDTIKNIDKICMLEDGDGGYSQAGGEWAATGRMNGTYGGGNSYANRGKHRVREHYSRSDGRRRDGRYSRDDGFRDALEEAAERAPDDRTRERLERMAREA